MLSTPAIPIRANAAKLRSARPGSEEKEVMPDQTASRQKTALHRRGRHRLSYSNAKEIKKMHLPKGLIDQLLNGALGIVKVDDKDDIFPTEIAV